MSTNIVFLDRDTIAPDIVLRKPLVEHHWVNYGATSKDLIIERLQHCDIAVVNKVELRQESLQQLPRLKMIAVAATGTNIIDLEYCAQHNIVVTNIRNYAATSVPEHALGLMIALRRNLLSYHRDVDEGQWQRSKQFCFFNHPINDLSGGRLGIIGNGELGKAMARLGGALGMEVVIAARKHVKPTTGAFMDFEQVLSTSDVISIHCPLTSETKDLLGMNEFTLMKNSALLINTARGGIVNEADLAIALQKGIIGGAGFDVLTQEPPPENNPLLALTSLPNFILTPHVAWASQQAMQLLANQLIDNIEQFVMALKTE